MMEKSCENCKFENRSAKEMPCVVCEMNYASKFKPMTNADRIKKMSDEELAEFLNDVANNCTQITVCDAECEKCDCDNEVCMKMVFEWLTKEVEE